MEQAVVAHEYELTSFLKIYHNVFTQKLKESKDRVSVIWDDAEESDLFKQILAWLVDEDFVVGDALTFFVNDEQASKDWIMAMTKVKIPSVEPPEEPEEVKDDRW